MKRMIKALVCIAIVAFTLSSCVEIGGGAEGKVVYTLGSPALHLKSTDNDINGFMAITAAYKNELANVPGVTMDHTMYVMEGNYKKCDAAIVKACEAAEKEASKYTLEGYSTIEVIATYFSTGEDKIIYKCTYGNPD